MRRTLVLLTLLWAVCLASLPPCALRQEPSGLAASPSQGQAEAPTVMRQEVVFNQAQRSAGVLVQVAVVGIDGELLVAPREVRLDPAGKWGTTALGALDASGATFKLSQRYPDFVEEIGGQRNRGQAGWMYSVNGEIPMVSAGRKQLKAGDKLIWWYSKSPGQAPPSWDQLLGGGKR
ncbi:MAG: DUF4430 domain-containing protein [Bacillota bacterium]